MHRHRIAIADKTFRHLEYEERSTRIIEEEVIRIAAMGIISCESTNGHGWIDIRTRVTDQQQLDEEIVVWRNHGESAAIAAKTGEEFGSGRQICNGPVCERMGSPV